MKLIFKPLICIFIVLGFSLCAFAQNINQPSSPSLPKPDFTITVKHDYRKGEVISLVQLERMFIKSPDSQSEPIGFESSFGFDEKLKFVSAAYISFYSNAKECRFPEKPDITFIVDGEPIRISSDVEVTSRGEGHASSFSELEGGNCNDSLDVILPQKIYLKIANAKNNIEVRTGKLKFQVSVLQLKALNEMARRMTQ